MMGLTNLNYVAAPLIHSIKSATQHFTPSTRHKETKALHTRKTITIRFFPLTDMLFSRGLFRCLLLFNYL